MRERPILFSGPMVRAILAGTKTQTRRVVKPQPPMGCEYIINGAYSNALCRSIENPLLFVPPTARSADHRLPCPYGQPGDRLWVKETWAAHWMYNDVPPRKARSGLPDDNYWYAADSDDASGSHGCPAEGHRGKWRPSIHMPRWASRLTLEITSVRVERLNEISEEDAKAEGAPLSYGERGQNDPRICFHRTGFIELWKSLNGPVSWEQNPYVWVVTFKRIDAVREEG